MWQAAAIILSAALAISAIVEMWRLTLMLSDRALRKSRKARRPDVDVETDVTADP